MKIKTTIEAKTIIISMMHNTDSDNLSLGNLQALLEFINKELERIDKLDNYQITYDISYESIERIAQYNSDIFVLDMDKEHIRLKKKDSLEALYEKYKADETISAIINEFSTSVA